MQNTRLSTLFDRALGQFSRWLQNPWRRVSLLIISVLFGSFLGTALFTVAGQRAELDVVEAALVTGFAEVVSWLIYTRDRRQAKQGQQLEPRPLLLELLNGLKLGLIYGAFVEAFKLGS
jgi:uncharacterized membrane protein YsdA (DUF1294 family)